MTGKTYLFYSCFFAAHSVVISIPYFYHDQLLLLFAIRTAWLPSFWPTDIILVNLYFSKKSASHRVASLAVACNGRDMKLVGLSLFPLLVHVNKSLSFYKIERTIKCFVQDKLEVVEKVTSGCWFIIAIPPCTFCQRSDSLLYNFYKCTCGSGSLKFFLILELFYIYNNSQLNI